MSDAPPPKNLLKTISRYAYLEERVESLQAEVDHLRTAFKKIAEFTDHKDPTSLRNEDHEVCLDTVHFMASNPNTYDL